MTVSQPGPSASDRAYGAPARLGGVGHGPIVALFRRASDPAAMAKAFSAQQVEFGEYGQDRHYFEHRFSLTCTLWLETSGNGVYVDQFNYHDTNYLDFQRKP